jgi:hypothetical protein
VIGVEVDNGGEMAAGIGVEGGRRDGSGQRIVYGSMRWLLGRLWFGIARLLTSVVATAIMQASTMRRTAGGITA